MASSQSSPKGQAPLCCNLCEIETKITTKCLDCDLLMCTKCRDKIHPKFKNAKDHRTVDIKDIGLYTQEMDFTSIKCQDHTGQNCCLFCVSCDKVVCPLCISKTHNGHDLIEISKGHEIKLDRLKQTQVKMQSNLQKLNLFNANLEQFQNSEREQYRDTKEKIETQNIDLKKAVDQFTERIGKEVEQKMNLHQKSIDRKHTKTIQLRKKVENQMSMLEDIITAKDAAKVFTGGVNFEQSISEVMDLQELNTNHIEIFCPGEITQKVFGSLKKISMKIALSEQFLTGLTNIENIAVGSDDSIWINCTYKPGILTKVKPEKGNLKDIHRIEIKVYGMAITQSGDLLLSTRDSTLKQVNNKTGKITDTKFSVAPLLTAGVHITKNNKVIVGAISNNSINPERSCIITMNTTGEHETIYENDKHNKPIFNLPEIIKTTSNGRICVLDMLSNNYIGQIVVFNQGADAIQSFRGHQNFSYPDKPFQPTDLAITPLDNIIVTDFKVRIFHILNSSGHYITSYETTDTEINYQLSLCFSTKGLLYIGSTTLKGSTDTAKLYIANISEY